jgi:nicotinate-nucleotide adenylyltransferase
LLICSRPGYSLDEDEMTPEVQKEFQARARPASSSRAAPCGTVFLDDGLKIDIDATRIRAALRNAKTPASLVPPAVLDYIEHHHLYK